MRRDEFRFLAVSTVAAGFVGGLVSGQFLRGAPALAQTTIQASPAQETVTARAFVLVDGSGKERANLRVADDGGARLTVLDTTGKRRATLGVTRSGIAALMLYDAADETRASLMSRSDGAPVLALLDASGGMRASLEAGKGGIPSLKMWDAAGKTVWSAP